MSVCLHHDNCNDGLVSAWILKQAFPDIETVGVQRGEEPPLSDVEDEHVIMADFCYEPEPMRQILDVADKVKVLDHHASAEGYIEELGEHENLEVTFDMDRSGAKIVWDEYGDLTDIEYDATKKERRHGKAPKLVEYVQDRDLWTNELDHTEAVSEWLFLLPTDPESFDYAHRMLRENFDLVTEMGQNIVDFKEDLTDMMVRGSGKTTVQGHKARISRGHRNIASLLGNKLAQEAEDSVGVVWWRNDQGFKLSLRGLDDGAPVNEIAESLGGGGHPNAAGAFIEDSEALEEVL